MLLLGDKGALRAQPQGSPHPTPSTDLGKQLYQRIAVVASGVPALLGVTSGLVGAGSEALKELREWKILER